MSFTLKPTYHIEFYLDLLVWLKVSKSHFEDWPLKRIICSHHDCLPFVLGLLIFGLDFLSFFDSTLNLYIIIDSNNPGDTEVWISGYRIVNLKRFFEGILIDLRRLNFHKIILDVDEILVGNYWNSKLLMVLKKAITHKSAWQLSFRDWFHPNLILYLRSIFFY